MRAGRRLALALLPASLALSCLSLSEVDEEVDGFQLATDMVYGLAFSECQWRWECCANGENRFDLGTDGFSPPECASRILISLQAGESHPAAPSLHRLLLLEAAQDLSLGRVKINEAGLQACLAFIEARACNEYVEDADACLAGGYAADDPCAPSALFDGLVPAGGECRVGADYNCEAGRCTGILGTGTCTHAQAEGETCTFDSECLPGLHCDPFNDICRVGAQLGQVCAYANPASPTPGSEITRCAEGLFCDPQQGRCVAPCTNGAECSDEGECPDELVCAVDRCRPPGDPGAPCDNGSDCLSTRCDLFVGICVDRIEDGNLCGNHEDCVSEYCSPFTGRCDQALAVGEVCDTSIGDVMCADSYCDWQTQDPEPTCTAYIPAGGDCELFDRCEPDTDPPLTCTDGKCRSLPLPDGITCPQGDWCESGICFDGVCDPGAQIGDSCDGFAGSLPCAQGLYCNRVGGLVVGTCEPYLSAGDYCIEHHQCYGQCELRWGQLLCDDTLPPHEDVRWCDGNPSAGIGNPVPGP